MALEWTYTGTNYSLGGYRKSFHWLNPYWYMLSGNKNIYKYNSSFILQDTIDIDNEDIYVTDIVESIGHDGSYWWLLIRNPDTYKEKVLRYDSNWNYTGYYKELGFPYLNIPVSIHWDGNYWWILDQLPRHIYKYNSSWEFVDVKYLTDYPLETYAESIFYKHPYWWVVGSGLDYVYKYNYDWKYITYYPIGSEDTTPVDIFWLNGWFMLGYNTQKVYLYDDNFFPAIQILIDEEWKHVYLEKYDLPAIKGMFVPGWSWRNVESMKILVNGAWKDVF